MTILKNLSALLNRRVSDSARVTIQMAFATLVVVYFLGWLAPFFLRTRLLRAKIPINEPPNGIRIKLQPRTFTVEARQQFSLQAAEDFDPLCYRVAAKIPEQQWEQTFTREELLNGVRAEWNPTHTGTYLMQFFCHDRPLGETGLSVVIRPLASRPKPKKVRWVLKNGNPIYRDNSFFEVPIMVSSEVESGSSFVPNVVDNDTQLKVLDQNGQLSNINPLVIQRNTAISEAVSVPFPIGAEYLLVAYEKEKGQASNKLRISWKELAPALSLAAYPSNVELYSAGLSSSAVQLYLTLDSRQIKPSDNTDVLYDAPPVFKSEPVNAVILSPSKPIGTYQLSAPTAAGTWNVNFKAPRLGLTTLAGVKVLPTHKFTLTAMAAGLLGILIARRRDLFAQSGWEMVLELVVAVGAAFLLYVLLLTGWISRLRHPEFILSYVGATVIGLVGGYTGIGVFKVAKKIILGPSA